MKEEIIEGNKLIAEFMGLDTTSDPIGRIFHCPDIYYKYDIENYQITNTCYPENLLYHKDWSWLMPVIGKISNECEEPEELDELRMALLCNDIDTAWDNVVGYIKNRIS